MKLSRLCGVVFCAVCAVPAFALGQTANLLDFEDAASFGGDDAVIPTDYFESRGFSFSAVAGDNAETASNVDFSFEARGRDGTDGFWTNKQGRDVERGGSLGNYFLKAGTGNLDYGKSKYFKLSIDYTEPSFRARAEIWDIDGPEQYQVTAYDVNGNEIGSLTSPQGGLNGRPWEWRFFAQSEDAKIQTIEIEAVGSGNLRGFAFDNFEAHPAPIPAALPLGAAGMGAMAIVRRMQRKRYRAKQETSAANVVA